MKEEKLRVHWVPQIPGPVFYVPVDDLEQAAKVLDILSAYDLFQFDNNIRGDFSNTGCLQVFDPNDTEDSLDGSWVEWYDEETGDDFNDWVMSQDWKQHLDDCFSKMRSDSGF